jgi:hypothetical protein
VNLRPPSRPELIVLLILSAVGFRFGLEHGALLFGRTDGALFGNTMAGLTLGVGAFALMMGDLALMLRLARPLAIPPRAVTPEPVMLASDVERVIYHPEGNDQEGWFLDASPEQWRAVYNLTRTRNNIPFNYIDGKGRAFPTKESLNNFRTQLVGAGLAYVDKSGTVALNAAGRAMVRKYSPPAPPKQNKKQGF